jgi:hypothetical protein
MDVIGEERWIIHKRCIARRLIILCIRLRMERFILVVVIKRLLLYQPQTAHITVTAIHRASTRDTKKYIMRNRRLHTKY